MGPNIFVVNVLLIMANYYVYRQRLFHQSSTDFIAWLGEVKARLRREKYICNLENKSHKFEKWEQVYDYI